MGDGYDLEVLKALAARVPLKPGSPRWSELEGPVVQCLPAIVADLKRIPELERLEQEVCAIFQWSEGRQTVEECEFEGSHDLSPSAWPAIATATRKAAALAPPAAESGE